MQEDPGKTGCLFSNIQAAREGILFARDLGLTSITLERDARLVMECIESSSLDLSLNGVVIHDIGLRAAEFNRFKA